MHSLRHALARRMLEQGTPLSTVANVMGHTSYRDTFKLVLLFAETEHNLRPEKITLSDFNTDFITAFLRWLEQERGCSAATRNQRLAALRAFAKYARTQHPEYLFESQKIMDLKAKKAPAPTLAYLSPDDVQSIFSQTDTSTKYGRRDMLLLSLMYDSGARVQEICDLRVRDVRLQKPPTVTLTGKGRKTRFVPIMASTASALSIYFSDNGLSSPKKADQPLFTNHQRGKLTRAGVTYILKKYFDAARQANPDLPKKISPHRAIVIIFQFLFLHFSIDFPLSGLVYCAYQPFRGCVWPYISLLGG